MTSFATQDQGFVQRLKAEANRDPKRTAVLGVLTVVLLVLAVRQIAKRTAPARAGAAVAIRNPASAGMPGLAAVGAAALPAEGLAEALPKRVPVVTRDLFTPNPGFYPSKETERPAPVVKPVDDTVARREAEFRTVQTQARSLALQSTVVGSVPTAIINGQVLRTNEWINGFEVVEISTRSCTVEKGGLRVTLEMSK